MLSVWDTVATKVFLENLKCWSGLGSNYITVNHLVCLITEQTAAPPPLHFLGVFALHAKALVEVGSGHLGDEVKDHKINMQIRNTAFTSGPSC